MGVLYNVDVRDARMQAVIDAIDENGPGTIQFGDGAPPSMGNVLCIIDLEDPSFVLEAGTGTITMQLGAGGTLEGIGILDGEATSAQIRDGTGRPIVTGMRVGTITSDFDPEVVLNSTSIAISQTVTLMQGSLTHGVPPMG